ncbi:hypothetical protein PRJ_2842 [Pseudomonas sp. XWY-1]|nr:hypothetical protein PRJ_2842 [Pseudomonas sp. XWY-1]
MCPTCSNNCLSQNRETCTAPVGAGSPANTGVAGAILMVGGLLGSLPE